MNRTGGTEGTGDTAERKRFASPRSGHEKSRYMQKTCDGFTGILKYFVTRACVYNICVTC
jgi:hypothetical protein